MTKFIFVRHGQSQANADRTIADPYARLTDEGMTHAKQMGKKLKNKGIGLIVCSPYIRAKQTAEIIAGEVDVGVSGIKVIDELRERSMGFLEGGPKDHPSEWYYESDGGPFEPKQAVLDRMHTAIKKLVKQSHAISTVLVVGHATSGFYLLEAAKGAKTPADFRSTYHLGNMDSVEFRLDSNSR